MKPVTTPYTIIAYLDLIPFSFSFFPFFHCSWFKEISKSYWSEVMASKNYKYVDYLENHFDFIETYLSKFFLFPISALPSSWEKLNISKKKVLRDSLKQIYSQTFLALVKDHRSQCSIYGSCFYLDLIM